MMSRLVVVNVPQISEEKLLELFSPFGKVTDVKLMYKANGNFKHMAQIGFFNKEDAEAALQALNDTFIKGNKISITEWSESKIESAKNFHKHKQNKSPKKKDKSNIDDSLTVKLKNLPKRCKKSMIKHFFSPLKPVNIRIVNENRLAYVKFSSEKDMRRSLKKDKSVIEGSQVKVIEYSSQSNEGVKTEDKSHNNSALDFDLLSKTGRLFIRNLSYQVTEDHLTQLFEKYGPIKEIYLPFDTKNNRTKGIAFVTLTPEKALQAFSNLDRTVFLGRILHLIPSKPKDSSEDESHNDIQAKSSYKKEKLKQLKENAEEPYNWNTLFFGSHALFKAIPGMFDIDKQKLLNPGKDINPAVLMAMGETRIVTQMKKFLKENGININSPLDCKAERSKTTIIVKNLPADTDPLELRSRFDVYGTIVKFIHPPDYCLFAIIQFKHASSAKKAFTKEAYTQFHKVPLFLEWAPENIFTPKEEEEDAILNDAEQQEKMEVNDETPFGSTLFVKNLNFSTSDENLREHFSKVGKIVHATISRNKNNNLSHGFGFVEFEGVDSAKEALKQLQHSMLDGHMLELGLSKHQKKSVPSTLFKTVNTIQKGSKLLVKNLAFQANQKEVTKLFEPYGKLRSVRLPKKLTGTGSHRGFAFVEFLNEDDAKKAYDSMKDSTHFYGRRLVLEWANSQDAE